MHGRLGHIPASEVELSVDAAPPHTVRLRGTVHERSFKGCNLELSSEVAVTLASAPPPSCPPPVLTLVDISIGKERGR